MIHGAKLSPKVILRNIKVYDTVVWDHDFGNDCGPYSYDQLDAGFRVEQLPEPWPRLLVRGVYRVYRLNGS